METWRNTRGITILLIAHTKVICKFSCEKVNTYEANEWQIQEANE